MTTEQTTLPAGRPKDNSRKHIVQTFLAMEVDASFFIQDAQARDFDYLRKPVQALGGNIEIHQVLCDEIYQLPGVRVWRRIGLIDEL